MTSHTHSVEPGAVHPKYPNVFSPIRLGPVEIPTRYFFAPHGSALSAGTTPLDDLVAYSAERVRGGGCGLVVVALAAHPRGRTRQPSPYPEENIAAFKVMADTIHAAGGKIFGQTLYHWIAAGQWQPLSPPAPALSPSVSQFGHGGRAVSTHAMSKAEIEGMLGAIRQSAANLRAAGFDGILLHGSHSALIEQFLSPYFNRRSDEYGGSFENRLRFAIEALQAARDGAGPDMAVGMRFNCDEQIGGGYDTGTAHEIVRRLCELGLLDYIDLDAALEPQQFHYGMPTGFERKQYYRPFVEKVREAAGSVPVLSVLGRITDMADAEAALVSGVCDVVGSARQLIAEPEFVQNARHGREERSRTCIACNWCTAAGGDGAQGCAINPASYRERMWGVATFSPAPASRRVVIVGAGPAGLEAARVCTLRGHEVTLLEARSHLGGALADWAGLPGREHYRQAIEWWQAEVRRFGVDLRLGVEADGNLILAERPDAVIVATGARYGKGGRSITSDVDIPGHDRDFVYRPEDILLGGARPSGKILVVDSEGYHAGVGIAEILAAEGAEVHFVTAGYSPVSARLTDSREDLYILRRLKAAGVRLRMMTWLRGIERNRIVLYDVHTGEEWAESADAVVLATGREPVDQIGRELEGKVLQVFTIGDALAARMLAAATYEGQKFARLIGEPGAPNTVSDAWFRDDPIESVLMPADAKRQ